MRYKRLLAMIIALATASLIPVLQVSHASGTSTSRVSVDSLGREGNGPSYAPASSADGRYIAFDTDASNLVAQDTNLHPDVFVHDRQSGTTTRVSVSSDGSQANGASYAPAINGDGRYIAFESEASNLVPGDTNGRSDIFVRDHQTGTTTRVSINSAGSQANGTSRDATISSDGRYVAFRSAATNLALALNLAPADTNLRLDIFVHDRQTGATTRVSINSNGLESNGTPFAPVISGDGRYVAFESDATNLVLGDTNGWRDIFVHDRETGTTQRVNVSSDGQEANNISYRPAISGDGRYVAFESAASNLVANDTNSGLDIFTYDRQTGVTRRVSVDSAGNQSNAYSYDAVISADGRYVAFESSASNLVAGDSVSLGIYVHDRQTGITTRVSVSSAGKQANRDSFDPAMSADGRAVAFMSYASNLIAKDNNNLGDVFVRVWQ